MSIKRYELHWQLGCAYMREKEGGDFVKHSDYAALRAEVGRMEKALRAIILRCKEGDPRTNWLPIIADLASAALSAKPAPEAAERKGGT